MSKTEFCAGALSGLLMLCASALAANAAELPPLPAGLAAPSTATHMPAFSLQTVAGGTLRAEELHGKVVIARFWATW